MEHCLVDVVFVKNEESFIFAKKIIISGITSKYKVSSKEFVFPYPTIGTQQENNFNGPFILGNLEVHKIELELTNALSMFKTVVTTNALQKAFISNYIVNKSTNIINLTEQ